MVATESGINPKDLAGQCKTNVALVPFVALVHEAFAMMDGADKYDPYNWRNKKVRASVYVSAALRHIGAWFNGEDVASDSRAHHLGHARACLGIVLDAMEYDCLVDDRPEGGSHVVPELLTRLQGTRQENVELQAKLAAGSGASNAV